MYRIIDGMAFKGEPSPNRWQVTRRALSSGQVELSIRRSIDWVQWSRDGTDDWRAYYADKYGADKLAQLDAEQAAEREEKNRERAGRRAKTRVRHLCKVQGLDTLLTLTYRANMQDPERAWKDLREFVRRVRRALPGFAFVAVPERQARGAIHWHLAVHRLPALLAARNGVKVKSFNVVRAIWRAVVGDVDGLAGGNVDVARRRGRSTQRSAAKVAAYISKYVAKGFDDAALTGAHRYSSSVGIVVPRAERREVLAESLAEVCGLVYGDAWDGELQLCGCWVCPYGDGAYFSAEVAPSGMG